MKNQSRVQPRNLTRSLKGLVLALLWLGALAFGGTLLRQRLGAAAQTKPRVANPPATQQGNPNDRAMAGLIQRLTNRSSAGLKQQRLADGTVSVDLQEQFQQVPLVRRNADGSLGVACVETLEEANAFFGRNLETGASFPAQSQPAIKPSANRSANRSANQDEAARQAQQLGISPGEYRFYQQLIQEAAQRRMLAPNAATITIQNDDGAGEGFNDPSSRTPEGGNSGTTLGQQRLNVFNAAAAVWSAFLDSSVPTTVSAQFNSLTPCTTSGGVLGSAGAAGVSSNFSNAPFSSTWYHAALANKLRGSDASADPEINARFNSDIDTGCLGAGTRFYYGLDNAMPANQVNLFVVVLHELGHGLGFASLIDGQTGEFFLGSPDIFSHFLFDRTTGKSWLSMTNAERSASALNNGNVLWEGASVRLGSGALTAGREAATGRVQLYTPATFASGSSISHFDTACTPNLLMEPFINAGLPLDLDLTRQQMRDLGWYRDTTADATPDTLTNVTPSGGRVTTGTNANLTWTNTGGFNRNVTIELSTDGGATFPTVIATDIANTGSFTWLVPNLPTSQARVRVREAGFAEPAGVSDANFLIATPCPALTINPPTVASGSLGAAYNQQFTQTGGVGAGSFQVTSGTLPPGLTLAANGLLSGTPTATGSFPFTLQVTDDVFCTGTRGYTLQVNCPAITLGMPANGAVAVPYNSSVAATPALPAEFRYQYTLANGTSLPGGLSLNQDTGALSGTPDTDGNFSFDIQAELFADNVSTGCIVTQTRSLNISLNCQANPVVTNLNDSGAGSLRDVLAAACANSTVTFANNVTGTLVLTSGQLLLNKNLAIQGPGANLLTISGNLTSRIFFVENDLNVTISGLTLTNGKEMVDDGGAIYSNGALTVSNCVFSGNSANNGGALRSNNSLILSQSKFTNNTAQGLATVILYGQSTVTDCTFAGNHGPNGGGLATGDGTLTLERSLFKGNEQHALVLNGGTNNIVNCTVTSNAGGLVQFQGATTTVLNSTFNANHGVFYYETNINLYGGSLTFKNTIIANSAFQECIVGNGSLISAGNNLDTDNSCNLTQPTDKPNLNVRNDPNGNNPLLGPLGFYGGVTETHSLLPGSPALNAGSNSGAPATDQRGLARPQYGTVDMGAYESGGFTLAVVSGSGQTASHNTTFTNPLVVSVTANGAGEPVEGGRISFTGPLSGPSVRPPLASANINANGQASLNVTANLFSGSYQVAASTLSSNTVNFNLSNFCVSAAPVVTNKNDSGAGSLRQALADACAGAVITFAPNVQGTITLTSGQLLITRPLTIQGPGAHVLTISGNQQSRIFQIGSQAGDVTIAGLTIANGYVRGTNVRGSEFALGGGIDNLSTGTVNVFNCVLTGNQALGGDASGDSGNVGTGQGGALAHHPGFSESGTLNLSGCLFTNNRAEGTRAGEGGGLYLATSNATANIKQSTFTGNFAGEGGGIFAQCEVIALVNTTISGNRAVTSLGGLGGGIYLRARDETLINCTITGNHSGTEGGGLWGGVNPPAKLQNTLIAGNTSATARCPDMRDIVNSLGHNLLGITHHPSGYFSSCVEGMVNGVNGDQLGTPDAPLDAKLGPLADNGGPTQTHALLAGSPALNAGTNSVTSAPYNLTTDQRGVGFPRKSGTAVDIGAFEFQCPVLTLNPASLPHGFIGTPYHQTLSVNLPGGAYQFSSPDKPAWLTLTSDGVLSGMPPMLGVFTFNLSVSSFGICTQSFPLTLTVICPTFTLTPATLPNGVQGTAYNQMLTTLPAGGNYSYAVTTNVLPPGLTLASNGMLSGTPTAAGNYAFAVTVSGWAGNGSGCTKTQSYNLLITGTCAPVTVNPITLATGTVGVAYHQTVSATGGSAPYTFAVTQGALPAGLTLDANTGALTGLPAQGGSFSFRLTATGLGGCSGSRTYVVTVSCGTLTFSPATLPNGTRGVAYNQQLTVGAASNATFSLQLGNLPPGFTLTSAGVLSGTTSQAATYNFTVKALAGSCQGTKAYTLIISTGTAALALSGDYDGDGKSDPALWSASDGMWRIVRSSNGQASSQSWGAAGDVTLLGDYEGDGKSDLAVFRPADATFYIKRSSDHSALVKQWGLSTDVPVPGDYDGDGKTDIAVWRGSSGIWYILRSSDGQYETQAWGAGYAPYNDVPVTADYDGDGKSDLAVFRRATGTWLVKRSSDGQFLIKPWGLGTDVPVAADYDGDGQSDFAVWRAGSWYIWQSATNAYRIAEWGTAGDQPGVGDYDGDGQADRVVWRATEQTWYIKCSANEATMIKTQGQPNDRPVSAARR